MKLMYLIWNQAKTEFFGTDEPRDAEYVSTGRGGWACGGVTAAGEAFRECYADEGEVLEITTIELDV